jgi:GT2 family glycosyltransferase
LEHLAAQTRLPDQLLVVDSSPDHLTRDVVADFPHATYLRSEAGLGTTATSRAIALAAASFEVLAFLDDDAFADPDWLERLLLPYADPAVAAVGGRARNGQPGEESEGLDQIGKFTDQGKLLGFFAADPGHDIDVDHLIGANMSIRADMARDLGGIRDYYPGTCLREESDMLLRLRLQGARIVFTPSAAVTHVAAPHPRGKRFDLRYHYYGHRNHVVLLTSTIGTKDPRTRRYVASVVREDIAGALGQGARTLIEPGLAPRARIRRAGGRVLRAGVAATALVTGGVAAARLQRVSRRAAAASSGR